MERPPLDAESKTSPGKLAKETSSFAQLAEFAQEGEAHCAKDQQRLLAQGLNSVRAALEQSAKITLGKRYRLMVEVQNINLWPQICLHLHDNDNPDLRERALIAVADLDTESAAIDFFDQEGASVKRVDMSTEQALLEIPVILKGLVRDFLTDTMAFIKKDSGKQTQETAAPSSSLSGFSSFMKRFKKSEDD